MTTTHKSNPFGLLEHSDDDDDEEVVKTAKPKKQAPPKEKEAKSQPQANKPRPVQEDSAPKKQNFDNKKAPVNKGPAQEASAANKEQHSKAKESRKLKGVPSEPHPLDRKSGTGQNPWDKKAKRGGGGKFNTGTINDDLKAGEEPESANKEEGEPEEAEKDAGLTLSEYYEKIGQSDKQAQAVINEAKVKAQQDLQKVLDKEKATKLSNKIITKIDDREAGPTKKSTGADSHAVAMNTEHAALLGFKTGFKAFTERKPEEGKTDKPAPKPSAEGGQPELKEVEGGAKPEETAEQAPAEGGDQKQGGGAGGRGGYKGKGRGGYNPNYKGRQDGGQRERRQDNKPPKFDDDGAFPKLG